ncbi:MAG: hypothetical protein IPN27_11750 [Cellvibrionales bacterium]|nr:hypothetical protein [Cellvibrionales bacterium]
MDQPPFPQTNVAAFAALNYIAAGAEGVSTAWWIPALVLVLGAIAKALQVYLTRAESEARALDSQPSQLRRWLLD